MNIMYLCEICVFAIYKIIISICEEYPQIRTIKRRIRETTIGLCCLKTCAIFFFGCAILSTLALWGLSFVLFVVGFKGSINSIVINSLMTANLGIELIGIILSLSPINRACFQQADDDQRQRNVSKSDEIEENYF